MTILVYTAENSESLGVGQDRDMIRIIWPPEKVV